MEKFQFNLKLVKKLTILTFILFFSSFILPKSEKPVLYIIGDSTVRNGSGKGADALWGWGSMIGDFFDEAKIEIDNKAIGGRSSRTFLSEGRWDAIMKTLKKGDYVIMQFGHNDDGPLDDTARARGTIRGIGKESKEIYNPIRKINETVYTYGYYMRKYIADTKAAGAIPIVCSPIPRNNFKDGKVKRNDKDYGLWAKQVAAQSGTFFIDLNSLISDGYDKMGAEEVGKYFPKDHTHTNGEEASYNAEKVVEGIKSLKKCKLKSFLK